MEPFQISLYKASMFLLKEHLVGKFSEELPGIVYLPQSLCPKISSFLYGFNPPLFLGVLIRTVLWLRPAASN